MDDRTYGSLAQSCKFAQLTDRVDRFFIYLHIHLPALHLAAPPPESERHVLPGCLDCLSTEVPGSYKTSQRVRKRIEECFGWLHMIGGTKKVKVRGRAKVEMNFLLAGCALNLLRIAKLAPPEMGAVRP